MGAALAHPLHLRPSPPRGATRFPLPHRCGGRCRERKTLGQVTGRRGPTSKKSPGIQDSHLRGSVPRVEPDQQQRHDQRSPGN